MKRPVTLVTLLALVIFATGVWAQGLPTAKPETVGLSSERLERVSRALRGEIEAGKIPGAVALVARKGQVVYFEAFGVRDKATGEAMPKDAIFRL
jgi:CubicO group peptidase (beta-lactamase class C family)